ncbi:hypothetical protein Tco_1370833 [Tanacetum coccineum]
MSLDNASSPVTYTSISSDSDGPSWGIPLMDAGELPEMHPYKEVAQQGQAPPLLHAYVPDPIELDEHVPVYVLEPEHPEYHVPSDNDMQVKDQPDDEDTEEEEPFEGSDETEPFEEDETAVTPPPPKHRGARMSVRPQTPMATSTQALIDAFTAGSPLFPLLPTSPTYDQAPLGHRAAMIHMRDDMPPRRRFAGGRNRALLAHLETLKTHAGRMEWQHQTADDRATAHRMRTSVLEARAQIDMVEDTGSSFNAACAQLVLLVQKLLLLVKKVNVAGAKLQLLMELQLLTGLQLLKDKD